LSGKERKERAQQLKESMKLLQEKPYPPKRMKPLPSRKGFSRGSSDSDREIISETHFIYPDPPEIEVKPSEEKLEGGVKSEERIEIPEPRREFTLEIGTGEGYIVQRSDLRMLDNPDSMMLEMPMNMEVTTEFGRELRLKYPNLEEEAKRQKKRIGEVVIIHPSLTGIPGQHIFIIISKRRPHHEVDIFAYERGVWRTYEHARKLGISRISTMRCPEELGRNSWEGNAKWLIQMAKRDRIMTILYDKKE
jgi:hypothetical protein